MKLSTRIGIVGFTLASCAFAAYLRYLEVASFSDPATTELLQTVQAQITAIRSQHYDKAYLRASSRFNDNNGLERFLETTRGDSSAIRQALRWEFGMTESSEGETQLEVRFFMPGGDALTAHYTVVRENREWKVDHVWFSAPTQPRAIGGLRL
jgi:hypothetical protein